MAQHHEFGVCSGVKTYATRANAIKAAQDKFGTFDDLRFFTTQVEGGRWIPVFFGQSALQRGVFHHFHVVA